MLLIVLLIVPLTDCADCKVFLGRLPMQDFLNTSTLDTHDYTTKSISIFYHLLITSSYLRFFVLSCFRSCRLVVLSSCRVFVFSFFSPLIPLHERLFSAFHYYPKSSFTLEWRRLDGGCFFSVRHFPSGSGERYLLLEDRSRWCIRRSALAEQAEF